MTLSSALLRVDYLFSSRESAEMEASAHITCFNPDQNSTRFPLSSPAPATLEESCEDDIPQSDVSRKRMLSPDLRALCCPLSSPDGWEEAGTLPAGRKRQGQIEFCSLHSCSITAAQCVELSLSNVSTWMGDHQRKHCVQLPGQARKLEEY